MDRALRFVLFFGIFLSVWGGMHLYVFARAAPVLAPHATRKALFTLGLALGSAYIVARVVDRRGLFWLGTPLEWIGATWMGVLFIAFACLLAADLISGFGRFFPSLPWRTLALVVAALLCGVATVQGLRRPAVREVEARVRNLPPERDGLRIVLVSDLHLGAVLGRRWLDRRIDQIGGLAPDLIVVCGDLIDGDIPRVAPMLPALRRLFAPLGVWAVSGNHEVYAGLDASAKLMRDAGFRVLRDAWAEAAPGLLVAGVDDLTARRQVGGNGSEAVARALDGRPEGAATIFLSHTPWRAEEAAKRGASLMLSGHTHAGQIFPFGFLVRLQYPLLAGTYDVGGMPVVVCRGTGTWGPVMRLFYRSEIVRITLRGAPALTSPRAAR